MAREIRRVGVSSSFPKLEKARADAPKKRSNVGKREAASAPRSASSFQGASSAKVTALERAFAHGDLEAVRQQLKGGTAESNAALLGQYRAQTGRDLEWDMRGFAPEVDLNPFDGDGLRLRGGLKGKELKEAFALLHGPRLEANAARIAELTKQQPLGEAANGELYRMLGQAGGEERALLAEKFQAKTGKDLTEALKPVIAAAVKANDARPMPGPPEKTVAVVVSSGNWKAMLDGKTDDPIGGYHWREIEAYVKEALANGYTPVFYTPDGLPPSPDALSLLQGKLGPALGFGLREGTGPDSPQGKAIIDGLMHPRSMASFDASKVATMHVAGGHGSHHDLIGHAGVERAGLELNRAGKLVTAVCHATPALGKLLEGGRATGFSPQFDQVMLRAGYILPEFQPPYDAHEGLRRLGADVSTLKALNINHTETQKKNGTPIITGTGPEATDDVARKAFEFLRRQR